MSGVRWGDVAFAWLAVATSGLAACRSHASSEDCQTMTDRYVDLAAREVPGASTMSPAQIAAVRDVERGLKRAEPSFRAVEDRCSEVTRAEVSCAIDSTSTKAWEGCLRSGGQ